MILQVTDVPWRNTLKWHGIQWVKIFLWLLCIYLCIAFVGYMIMLVMRDNIFSGIFWCFSGLGQMLANLRMSQSKSQRIMSCLPWKSKTEDSQPGFKHQLSHCDNGQNGGNHHGNERPATAATNRLVNDTRRLHYSALQLNNSVTNAYSLYINNVYIIYTSYNQ